MKFLNNTFCKLNFFKMCKHFLLAPDLPYFEFTFVRLFINFLLKDFLMAFDIAFWLTSQLITFFDNNLFFCLLPMFTAGIFNVGASKIALDEFPIITSEYFIKDRKFSALGFKKNRIFFLLSLTKFFDEFEITFAPMSAFDCEKKKFVFLNVLIEYRIFLNCFFAVLISNVEG